MDQHSGVVVRERDVSMRVVLGSVLGFEGNFLFFFKLKKLMKVKKILVSLKWHRRFTKGKHSVGGGGR